MKKTSVFAREVKELVARGIPKIQLPEGKRFFPEAADLVKEKGIQVTSINAQAVNTAQESKIERVQDGTGQLETDSAGKNATDKVGRIAARSPFLLVFDTKGELAEVPGNPYGDSGGGEGPFMAE